MPSKKNRSIRKKSPAKQQSGKGKMVKDKVNRPLSPLKTVAEEAPQGNHYHVKLYRRHQELIVAIADCELVGKTFKEGELRLDVSHGFYGGDLLDEATMLQRLGMATIANLVGKRCISAASRHGFIETSRVIIIDGVPHAQIFLMLV